ncbi:hypothetical protein LX32DRAFT_615728 [Colletotrichum zoysiae]|uniref:BTB domain-containing protein n=1 Tax=Colletotrichum zoysiae TaxID=1216348 RepID=A0AAD9HJJ4_9PEZI|nr:hypothetical protein LX32DRAFT_615728 [Colletotrichum zoysiae]
MVDEIVHAVDPQGDVVLVLRNPKAPFAVWKDTDWAPPPVQPVQPGKICKKCKSKSNTCKKYEICKKCRMAEQREQPSEAEQALLSHDTNAHQESEIKFLLSSRHLILASRYYDKKVNGTWEEATPHPADGRYHLEASDWDPAALLILMNVIHGRTRSVPRRVDCEMLAKIAVLVDYYDCLEAVEVFSSMWIDALNDQLPSECSRELVLWLLIAHVFHQDDVFAKITKTAVLGGQGPMPTLELPIPSIVVDLIDWRRQDAIAFILNSLNDLLVSLRKEPGDYNHVSSCVNLGALDRAMYKENLLGLSEPYLGHAVTKLETTVRAFRTPDRNSYSHRYSSGYDGSNLWTIINDRLDSESAKNKEGFSLSEVTMSDVSRREGKDKSNDDDELD